LDESSLEMGDDAHNYEIEILHGVCKKGKCIGHEKFKNIHHHTFWKIKSLMKNDGCNINLITICVVDNQIKIYFVGWDIINIVINWQHQKVDTKTKTFGTMLIIKLMKRENINAS